MRRSAKEFSADKEFLPDRNKKLSKLDLELAEKLLEMRYIRSSITGTIMKIA